MTEVEVSGVTKIYIEKNRFKCIDGSIWIDIPEAHLSITILCNGRKEKDGGIEVITKGVLDGD